MHEQQQRPRVVAQRISVVVSQRVVQRKVMRPCMLVRSDWRGGGANRVPPCSAAARRGQAGRGARAGRAAAACRHGRPMPSDPPLQRESARRNETGRRTAVQRGQRRGDFLHKGHIIMRSNDARPRTRSAATLARSTSTSRRADRASASWPPPSARCDGAGRLTGASRTVSRGRLPYGS